MQHLSEKARKCSTSTYFINAEYKTTKENHPPETVAMTCLRHQGMEKIMEIKEKSFFLGLLKQPSIFQPYHLMENSTEHDLGVYKKLREIPITFMLKTFPKTTILMQIFGHQFRGQKLPILRKINDVIAYIMYVYYVMAYIMYAHDVIAYIMYIHDVMAYIMYVYYVMAYIM